MLHRANLFQKRTAARIAGVCFILAAIASPVAWYIERAGAEATIVSLAIEESERLLIYHKATRLEGPDAPARATEAAKTISGGLFDIAEIYDRHGRKLAESMTTDARTVEDILPKHGTPTYKSASYESLKLADGRWVLRVFVPLFTVVEGDAKAISGYFEGVRIVPNWQRDQLFTSSLTAALMVAFAALLCGVAVFPVIVHLSKENERKTHEVLDSNISMMEAMGRAIAIRDSDTGSHNYRVAWIATRIAEKIGITGSEIQSLIAGSFLHDVGKIGIPDEVLRKPGKLDDQEVALMRTHVRQGEEIVTGMGWLDGANAIVAAHHEKWDGSGYPRQLKGESIPIAARIFAIADVFDALCSKRPYKKSIGFDQAMTILETDTGRHFDPSVMAIFQPMAREIFDRLAMGSEDDAQRLLGNSVRKHFEL